MELLLYRPRKYTSVESLNWQRTFNKVPREELPELDDYIAYKMNSWYMQSFYEGLYYMPFEPIYGKTHAQMIREIGGICGAKSSYPAFALLARGVPMNLILEPIHLAYYYKKDRHSWTLGNSLSAIRHTDQLVYGSRWENIVVRHTHLNNPKALACNRIALSLAQITGENGFYAKAIEFLPDDFQSFEQWQELDPSPQRADAFVKANLDRNTVLALELADRLKLKLDAPYVLDSLATNPCMPTEFNLDTFIDQYFNRLSVSERQELLPTLIAKPKLFSKPLQRYLLSLDTRTQLPRYFEQFPQLRDQLVKLVMPKILTCIASRSAEAVNLQEILRPMAGAYVRQSLENIYVTQGFTVSIDNAPTGDDAWKALFAFEPYANAQIRTQRTENPSIRLRFTKATALKELQIVPRNDRNYKDLPVTITYSDSTRQEELLAETKKTETIKLANKQIRSISLQLKDRTNALELRQILLVQQ